MTEIKESKKSDIILNSVKIVGKFSEKKYGKINLITYVAYNFGFEFEEVDNSNNDNTYVPTSNVPTYSSNNRSVKPASNYIKQNNYNFVGCSRRIYNFFCCCAAAE